MSFHISLKHSVIIILSTIALSALAAESSTGQEPIIIENGYVAGPHNSVQQPKTPEDRDPNTYQDPEQYDYDNVLDRENDDMREDQDMDGKYDGGMNAAGMHGGGGRR